MLDMKTAGERLRAERKAAGISQQELASIAFVSKQAISNIENNGVKDPSAKTLDPICRRLGLSLHWLLTGLGAKHSTDDEDWSNVLAHRVAASLGPGALPDEYAETHKLKFRAESLRRKRLRPELLAVCYGKGDSMYPRIHNGDAILFDTSDNEPKDGHIFVVSHGNDLFAKKLLLLGGRWFLASLNPPDAKPELIDEHRGFTIHGRVRWVGSWEG